MENPTPEYFAHWARIYLGWRQNQRALNVADAGLERFPRDGELYWARGKVRYALAQIDLAMNDFDAAINYQPTFSRSFSDRGLAHFSAGDFAAAKTDFVKAIEIDEQMPINHAHLARFLASCPAEGLRDISAALEHAQQAVDMRPEYWFYLDTMATAYAAAGRFDWAIDRQNHAISLLSSVADDWRRLANNQHDLIDEYARDVADDLDRQLREAKERLRLYKGDEPFRGVPEPFNTEYPRYNPGPL